MLLKIAAQGFGMDDIDTLRLDRAAEAIRYAADNGARVINWSGFVRDDRPYRLEILKEAIAYAASKGVLLVTGAGNYAKDLEDAANYTYPQCFDLDNIVNVAEVDYSGDLYHYEIEGRSFGSSYGATRVHIGAIGDNYTTFLKNNVSVYALGGGTSNAAPVVSGVAALVLSVRPDLDYRELKKVLLESVTPVESLQGKIVSGGVVNARRALEMALNYRLR
jgi:subtilisin family serine protease